MKKKLLFLELLFMYTMVNAQVTDLPLSPAASLSASTLYTNDQESMTALQTILNACGPGYTVPSLHASTSIYSNSSYTFEPGNIYTIQITGSATATGDLANPGAAGIYFGISLGSAQTTTDPATACAPFPTGSSITSYAGTPVHGPLTAISPVTTVDMMTPFLTGIQGVGFFPNSSASSVSTITSSFITFGTVSTFNIEAFPVTGDPAIQYAQNGCGGHSNAVTAPTNTTLTITKITITKSCTPPPAPVITIRGIEPLNHGTQLDVSVSTSAPTPYLWYVNGTLVFTAYNSAVTINGGSNCNVMNSLMVQVSNGCGSSSASTTYTRPCSRMITQPDNPDAANSPKRSLAIFPNPVRDMLSVTLPDSVDTKHAAIRITDMYGRQVHRVESVSGTNSISISGLSAGIYFVEIYTGSKSVVTKKIVKN